MLTLYFAPGASSMAPHIALHEVEAEYEPRPVSLRQRETRSDWYLALNPAGQVPTLLINGRPLTEVAGILFYLARQYPAACLLPEGTEAEAQVVSWMSFIAATQHPSRRQGVEHSTAIYALTDRRLGANDWVAGRYSIADIHLFRLFWRFKDSLQPDPGAFPNLTAHHDRMMARPAVQRTLAIEAAIGYDLPA